MFKKGMIGIEAEDWKHRRKLVSKVFTHEFISSHIPMMIDIANGAFEDLETKSSIDKPEPN